MALASIDLRLLAMTVREFIAPGMSGNDRGQDQRMADSQGLSANRKKPIAMSDKL